MQHSQCMPWRSAFLLLALMGVAVPSGYGQSASCGQNAREVGRKEDSKGGQIDCECDPGYGYDTALGSCVAAQAALPPPPQRSYTPSGNAFIGGTTWITGYNLQSADPKLRAKMQGLMARQMKLAGLRYSEGVDFQRYNFVLGIGVSTNQYVDLASRVVFDEYSNGQFSAHEQELYASLKGRQFNELGCHSNGAMVCLAALKNKDIVAERVVLYGPQITLESLRMWDQLVREGRVKSVEINIDRSDPVPPLSLSIGGGMVNAVSIASLALLRPPTLKDVIQETAPRLTVRSYNCGNGIPDLDCHDMRAYKRNTEKK